MIDKTKLKETLIQGLNIPDITPRDMDDDAPLFIEGLGLDSLDAVEVVLIVQENYGVEIKTMEEGMEAFKSINSLVTFIEERQG